MITPDTKDWTWVLEAPCPECGYDASTVDPADIGDRTRAGASPAGRPCWPARRRASPARARTSGHPLEYACHVRDVFSTFDGRLQLMLAVDDAEFANWDQDVTAVESRYAEQDPARRVGRALAAAGVAIAARFDGVSGAQWDRTGARSDGAVFTTRTFGRYFLHDIEHHLHDVGG